MMQIVRIGTVTTIDPAKRTARVKFQDAGTSSGWLYVLASRPYIPVYDARPQQTEDGGNVASHRHDLTIKPWMPQVNATVLVLYLPVEGGDGFILGEIGALGQIKQ